MPAARSSARAKGGFRGAKTKEARSDRFAFVTVIVDRQTGRVSVEHPWISAPEARGIIESALESFEMMPFMGTSSQDMDDEDYDEDD